MIGHALVMMIGVSVLFSSGFAAGALFCALSASRTGLRRAARAQRCGANDNLPRAGRFARKRG